MLDTIPWSYFWVILTMLEGNLWDNCSGKSMPGRDVSEIILGRCLEAILGN